MEERLEQAYDRLQTLNIQSTRDNMEKLLQTLYDIRDVYNQLKEEKADAGTRTADHSE